MPLTNQEALTFLNAKLGKIDSEVIRPLTTYTFTRDLPRGSDIDRTVEALVLRRIQEVGGQGTRDMQGRSWIGRNANDLKGVNFVLTASATRVFTAGREAKWTGMELERAQALGFPFDAEQVTIINEIFQREANQVAYLGDKEAGIAGLLNSTEVGKVAGQGLLADDDISAVKIPDLLNYLNSLLIQAEEKTGDVTMPSTLLVTPEVYGKLFSLQLPDASATSITDYLAKRSIAYAKYGRFQIYAVKELKGIGAKGGDRAVLYTPDASYLKFNYLPVWREKTYDKGLEFCAAYLWRIAEPQIRHPETLTYIDNL